MNTVTRNNLQPNSGNTRLDSQNALRPETSVGIDWLDFRGLLCPSRIVALFDWVADHCDDAIDWQTDRPAGRYMRFSHGFRSVRGGIYAYELTDGAAHVWISLPGQALAACGSTMAQVFVAKQCKDAGLRCTRLDLYLDDCTGRLAKLRSQIKDAWQQGKHSGFRDLAEYSSGTDWRVAPEQTMYVGSRQSSSFVRIYDKGDRVRWERQTGRDIADTVLSDLIRVHEDNRKAAPLPEYDRLLGEGIVSHLTNGIDFLDRKDKNLSRGTRCPFWSEFLSWLRSPQFKVVRHAVVPMLERTLQWLDRQVSKTMALIKDMMGTQFPHWLSGLVEGGRKRYKLVDRLKIEIHRAVCIC